MRLEGMVRRKHDEDIAANLRALRARRNVSQAEVAKTIGVNVSTLGAWEQRGGISLDNARALAAYYGVNIDELAGRQK